jgi:uncharacterized membrane protein YccC
LALDDQHHAGLPVDRRRADRRGRSDTDRRHVAETDVDAAAARYRDLGQLLGRADLSFGADDDALVGAFDEPSPAHAGRAPGGLANFLQRQAVLHQALRVDLHLELPDVAAEDDDIGDTRQTQQMRLQRPFGQVMDIHRRAARRGQADD